MTRPFCCFIGEDSTPCSRYAEWNIFYGQREVENTQSCTKHVGEMLTDAPVHYIYPIAS